MKFWSLSRLIENNPAMPSLLTRDLLEWTRTGRAPDHMFAALQHVARCTAPQFAEGVALVHGVACGERRIFLSYPDANAFEQLDRFCVFETDSGALFGHVDALH